MKDPGDIGPVPPEASRELSARPVADRELGRLLDCLAEYRLVVLAVSGGSDSMALMALVARWLGTFGTGAPRVEVVTVDHGLRPQSGEEARWVRVRARALGLKHTILVWEGEKPTSGIQEAARDARYRLLADHALASRSSRCAIVTAHTEDDQGETFLMRLARGSGIDGLSGMPARRPLTEDGRVELVRPLLEVGKGRLVASLEALGIDWVEDPSNERLDFERARVRAGRAALAAVGLTNDKLAASARRLARAREALERALDELLAAALDAHDGVFAEIGRRVYLAAAAELRVRALMRVLTLYGGEAKAPRLAQVEALAEALSAREGRDRVATTLGGCIVSAGSRSIRIFRESSSRGLPEIALAPGSVAIWDGRFHVGLAGPEALRAARVKTPVVVRALGASAYATLRARLDKRSRLPSRAAATLPAFWAGGDLIAVPQLAAEGLWSDTAGRRRHEVCTARFVGWERVKQPDKGETRSGPGPKSG